MVDHNSTFEERCEELIYHVFGGIHRLSKKPTKSSGSRLMSAFWALSIRQREMSTYDDDLLTRLVIYSHKYAVRACVKTAGMHLRVVLSERKREGQFFERHPSIEDVIRSLSEKM